MSMQNPCKVYGITPSIIFLNLHSNNNKGKPLSVLEFHFRPYFTTSPYFSGLVTPSTNRSLPLMTPSSRHCGNSIPCLMSNHHTTLLSLPTARLLPYALAPSPILVTLVCLFSPLN
ncbi:hypothetical protein QL285_082677 [Trifolium repens]|nr:hypothetical protein QL285_082677 [Trifolium repens]